jgi:hypothetical protein
MPWKDVCLVRPLEAIDAPEPEPRHPLKKIHWIDRRHSPVRRPVQRPLCGRSEPKPRSMIDGSTDAIFGRLQAAALYLLEKSLERRGFAPSAEALQD